MGCYRIVWSSRARKDFNKLDNAIKLQIDKYLEKVINSENPLAFGDSLTENLVGFRSYRINKYRVIVEIQNDKLIIYIVSVGKRETIYDDTDKRFN